MLCCVKIDHISGPVGGCEPDKASSEERLILSISRQLDLCLSDARATAEAVGHDAARVTVAETLTAGLLAAFEDVSRAETIAQRFQI